MSDVRTLAVAVCASVGILWLGEAAPAHSLQADHPATSVTTREVLRSGQGQEYDTLVTIRQISDRTVVLTVAGGDGTNIAALKTAHGVVIVDTTVSPLLARAVRRQIDQAFGGAPIVAVINTHGHGDHAYGNQVFAGSLIIGHTRAPVDLAASKEALGRTLAAIKAAVPRLEAQLRTLDATSDKAVRLRSTVLYYKAMLEGLSADFTFTPPWLTFTDQLVLDLGDRRLELTSYGTAHSGSDIIIHCPEEGLWMTGDLFAAGRDPYVDSERVAALDRWAANLDRMLSSAATTKAIVPGHGALLSAADLQKTREFVRSRQKLYAGRESAFNAFKAIYERAGVDEAVSALGRFRSEPNRYFVLHLEIDTYAYRLMNSGRLDDALKIFTVLAEYFPEDWQSFDSLGEVQLKLGQTALAAESFRKSLALDPNNQNAIEKLKALEKK